MMEVVVNPVSSIAGVLLFAIGITAITFIAIILLLDHQQHEEVVQLPEK